MARIRIVMLVLCALAPGLAYRLGQARFWPVIAVLLCVSAALAAYVLWEDDLLRGVIKPRGLDATTGLVSGVALFLAASLVFRTWVAPPSEAMGVMRRCGLDGPWLPRPDPHGITVVWEWMRAQTCRGYAHTLGLLGPGRGAAIAIIAFAEELAWRGGVQQWFSERYGSTRGWLIAAAVYGLAHAATGNALIGLLAFGGGLLWGGLYRYRGRLVPSIASHVAFSYFLFFSYPLVSF